MKGIIINRKKLKKVSQDNYRWRKKSSEKKAYAPKVSEKKAYAPKISNNKSRYKNYSNKPTDYSDLEKIVWKYSSSKNNDFWFVDVEWQEKGYFVYPKNLNGALDGDEVEAVLQTFNRRKEAIITKVLKRAERVLVWSIEFVKDFAFVILDNPAFKNDVHISNKKLAKYKGQLKKWDKVAIKITDWSGKNPEWSIIEILGDKEKRWVDILSIALEWWARIKFWEMILREAESLVFEEQPERIDLTKKLIFTIDGDDAKDLDDAILVEKKDKNYKLIVSIADVAEYVQEGSALDREALKRWNSIYLVDRVIPMLPEKLSNDLCSLNPHTKKLTLSCEILLDEEANIVSKKVYESIIESKFRLTYREVQEMLEWKLWLWDELKFGWSITQELLESIKVSLELKEKITSKKQKAWILNFDFPETKFVLDTDGHPLEIKKYERYESMKIIEEFMILANESVWELFQKIPFLYRIHEIPNDDDVEKLRNTLQIFGFKLPYKAMSPKIVAQILKDIEGNPKEKLLQKLILRSLEKAIYSPENEWHFWLNLEFYSHFTSPIRRYPDLQIHRIIKEKLHQKLSNTRTEHYKDILKSVSKHTSDTERAAEKLEYAVKDLMICKYYEDKIGQEFQWVVSGTIASWMFIELENTAEWFISIEQVGSVLGYKKSEFLPDDMKFEFTKDIFLQVWDTIKIKISSIEMEKRRLNFDFIEKIIK